MGWGFTTQRSRPGRAKCRAAIFTKGIIAAGCLAGMTSIPLSLPNVVEWPHEENSHALRAPRSGCRFVRTDRSVRHGQPDTGRDIRPSGIRERTGDEFLRPLDSDD